MNFFIKINSHRGNKNINLELIFIKRAERVKGIFFINFFKI